MSDDATAPGSHVSTRFDTASLAAIDAHLGAYVGDGRLAGCHFVLAHGGEVVHDSRHGWSDRESGRPVRGDELWRIYSMTKPVTSLAALNLCAAGTLSLDDPVSTHLPEFAAPSVWVDAVSEPRPVQHPITVRHLLTHTSGLTYGFLYRHPVDALYRGAGYEFSVPKGIDVAAACTQWARFPLVHEPGHRWNYSVATDVLGRLIEVVTGESLDDHLRRTILRPLGMNDTDFWVDDERAERLAAMYVPEAVTHRAVRSDAMSRSGRRRPLFMAGGGGLISSAADYLRFARMLAAGGEIDGVCVASRSTVHAMTTNQLPGGHDIAAIGEPVTLGDDLSGVGFGFGVAVVVDPARTVLPSVAGEFSWSGAATTTFWVDPVHDVIALFFSQLLPSHTHPVRAELKRLVYSAIRR